MPKNEHVDTAAFSFIQNSYFTVVLAIASFHKRAIYVFMAEFVMCKRFINRKCKRILNSRPRDSEKAISEIYQWNAILIEISNIWIKYYEILQFKSIVWFIDILIVQCNFIEILEHNLIRTIFLWNWNANKPYIFILRKSYLTNMTP